MSDVTRILSAIEHGDPQAGEQLLPFVYDELTLKDAAVSLGLSQRTAERQWAWCLLGISPRKADQVWAYARAWLREELGEDEGK